MRRLLVRIAIGIFILAGIYAVYAVLFDPSSRYLPIAVAVSGLLGVIAAADQIWDKYFPRRTTQPRSTTPDEIGYLEGRLRDFQREHEQFVELAGETAIRTRFDAYIEAFTSGQLQQKIREYDDIAKAAVDYKRFVIVGDPGAGKSTSLRYMAEMLTRLRLNPNEKRPAWLANLDTTIKPPLPLWIFLGDSQNPAEADKLLDHWWEKYSLPNTAQAAMNNHGIWLFMDGLNEMPEIGADRKSRAQSLKQFLEVNADVPAVITCRGHDYDETLNLGLPVVRVQPLDDGRIAEFIRKRGSEGLLEKVQGDDALLHIARNPYTLAMLIEIYHTKAQLPANLNKLYEIYTDKRHEDYLKVGKVKISWKKLKPALGKLGFRMIAARKGTSAPMKWARHQIGRRALEDGVALGVLIEDGKNIRFYHQSLHVHFALPDLQNALKERWTDRFQKDRRTDFINGIGDLGEGAAPAVFALAIALSNPIVAVRRSAAEILERIGKSTAPVVLDLIPALGDPDNYVRQRVANSLWNIGEAAAPAVSALIIALADSDGRVRWQATNILGRMGKFIVPALVAAFADSNRDIQSSLADVLAYIGEDAAPAIPILIAALADSNGDMAWRATNALGLIGEAAVSPLITALDHPEYYVRSSAAWALGLIGEAAAPAVPALIIVLTDPDSEVRRSVVYALENIGILAIPALIIALADLDSEVRKSAIEALGKIGKAAIPAVPVLIKLLKDATKPYERYSSRVCDYAAEALEKIGTPEALEAVRKWRADPQFNPPTNDKS